MGPPKPDCNMPGKLIAPIPAVAVFIKSLRVFIMLNYSERRLLTGLANAALIA